VPVYVVNDDSLFPFIKRERKGEKREKKDIKG
jgi:hypothetical protein